MARFKLNPGDEQKAVGEIVLQLAEAAGANNGQISDEKQKAELEGRLLGLIETSFRNSVKIVYDTPDKIHIVIPYLGKWKYSDNNFANEAMGGIVIMGCGK